MSVKLPNKYTIHRANVAISQKNNVLYLLCEHGHFYIDLLAFGNILTDLKIQTILKYWQIKTKFLYPWFFGLTQIVGSYC